MAKRKIPFSDYSPLQSKIHVNEKIIDERSCDAEKQMKKVYDKTLRLLQEGSKNLRNHSKSSTASIICECSLSSGTQLISGQKFLNRNGQLCSECTTLENGRTSATSSDLANGMDVEADSDDVSSLRNNVTGITTRDETAVHPSSQASACICTGCGRCFPSNESPPYNCSWCCRKICSDCIRNCELCHSIFCPICSIIDYDQNIERSFCLQCRAS